ncbi:MAG: stage II sporulation protein M [Nanoarchaeota archaeon]
MKKAKKTRRSFIGNSYRESLKYIYDSRNFIYLSLGLFFGASLAGFFLPVPQSVVEQIAEFIRRLLEETKDMGQFDLIRFIFLNNLQSSFIGMMFGILLGIFPALILFVNGYLLGFVSLASIREEGILVLWRLFPHGIFELPAVFISTGLGLKFGTFIFRKNKSDSFRKYFWNSLQAFLLVVVPLLIIAAIIEGTLIIYSG